MEEQRNGSTPLTEEGFQAGGRSGIDAGEFLDPGDEFWGMLMRSAMNRSRQVAWLNAFETAIAYEDAETTHSLLSLLVLSSAEDGRARQDALAAMTQQRPPFAGGPRRRGGFFSRLGKGGKQEEANEPAADAR